MRHLITFRPPFILFDSGEGLLEVINGQAAADNGLDTLPKYFNSAYVGLRNAGVVLFAIALVAALVRYATSGGKNREMAKDWVIRICIAAMVLGAATTIVAILINAGREM